GFPAARSQPEPRRRRPVTLLRTGLLNWHPQARPAGQDRVDLADVQAGIPRHHGRNHAPALPIRLGHTHDNPVGPGPRSFAGTRSQITSGLTQFENTSDRYEGSGGPAAPVVLFALTAAGYRALGIEPARWPDEGRGLFSQGMRSRGAVLGDTGGWDSPYHEG